MANKKTPTGGYEVGYAKTPVRTQFKKGKSGHPGGRRNGCRNYKTNLREVMELEIDLTERGKRSRVEMCKALLLRAVQDALNGDHKARADLLDRFERLSYELEEAVDPHAERAKILTDAIAEVFDVKIP